MSGTSSPKLSSGAKSGAPDDRNAFHLEELESRLLLSVMPLNLDITHLICDTDPDAPDETANYNCFIEFQQGGNVITSFLTPITLADADSDNDNDADEDNDLQNPGINLDGWSLTANVDTTRGEVGITIRVRDHDGGVDDSIDVSPISGARDFFRLRFDPLTGRLTNEDGSSLVGHDRQGITGTEFFSGDAAGSDSADRGQIRFTMTYGATNGDSDGDGLLDTWETWGISRLGSTLPADLTQTPDFRLANANPDHKDIYVEVDAMLGLAPQTQAINDVINAFAAVPNALVNNPDGRPGITLHVDLDELNITRATWNTTDLASNWPTGFDDIKLRSGAGFDGGAGGFGTAAEHGNAALLDAKELAYRYAIFGDQYAQRNSIFANQQTLTAAGNLAVNGLGLIAGSQSLAAAGNLTVNGLGNIAAAQSPTAAGNLALNAAAPTFAPNPVRIFISSAGNDSARAFTISGTNAAGNPITENLTGSNGGDAGSALRYRTVTAIAVDGATAGNVSVGTIPWFAPMARIFISSSGNDSARTFTISGTDAAGNAITENLTGTNGGDAGSALRYRTVNSIAADGATAGNVSVGSIAWFAPANPAQVWITSFGNDSARTFTIRGTDALGNTITENVTGANTGDAGSALRYRTVNSITVNGATAGIVSVGTIPLTGSSGKAEVSANPTSSTFRTPGNDFMVTLGGWDVDGGTREQQAGTFMHELGHTLGLLHGGNENTNNKPNYHSIMNYTWQLPIYEVWTNNSEYFPDEVIVSPEDGTVWLALQTHESAAAPTTFAQDRAAHPTFWTAASITQAQALSFNNSWTLDYSRDLFNMVNENAINEANGFAPSGVSAIHTSHVTRIGPIRDANENPITPGYVNEVGAIDLDGTSNPSPARDVNFDGVSTTLPSLTTLNPFVDWNALRYVFRDGPFFADRDHTAGIGLVELTFEEFQLFSDVVAPHSTLTIGTPQYPANATQPFVTSATQFSIAATDSASDVHSVSYRFFLDGSTAPDVTRVIGDSAQFTLAGLDGLYRIETLATDNAGNTETAHVQLVYLDNTAPVATINQPAAGEYAHSAILTLDYIVSDGAGSGVASFTPTLDGATTLAGHGLQSGQLIIMLTELTLGTHTFTIGASDNLQNSGSTTVTFEVIVTPESIKEDVNYFFSIGDIKNKGQANALLAKLNAAANAIERGQGHTAINNYEAFIHHLNAQSGKGVDATAAAIMIADAEWLIEHIDRFLPPSVAQVSVAASSARGQGAPSNSPVDPPASAGPVVATATPAGIAPAITNLDVINDWTTTAAPLPIDIAEDDPRWGKAKGPKIKV